MSTPPRSRWLIGALAAAVLVAAIVLIVASRGSATPAGVPGRAVASNDPALEAEHFPEPTAGSAARPAPPPSIVGPGSDPAPANPATDPGEVRDHRSGTPVTAIERKTILPPTGPIVFDQKLSIAAAADAKPVALECAKQIPAAARGTKPVIQVRLQVSVKNGRMTVDDALTDLRDVAGDDLAKSVSACVKQSAIGKSYDAHDQADVEHYQITLPLKVP
ncbi:MAG: hypothetical protein K8W52_01925 [Deltaproteobacteria bacterium]|nr:hypothetical protein [Deltaproteobacteria bacterium]